MLSSAAKNMIDGALKPMLDSGKEINRIQIMVCPQAPISQLGYIETNYGLLLVMPGEYVPKGYSYLIEKPRSRGGVGFNWVSKPEK